MRPLIDRLKSRKLWITVGTMFAVGFGIDTDPNVMAGIEAFIGAGYVLAEAIIDAKKKA